MLGRGNRSKGQRAPERGSSEPFTYIHRGTTVTGDLEAEGRVRVHGTIRGNVSVQGVLEVAEAGVIEGTSVIADEVKILGRVAANVTAKGKIEIWKDGHLEGDVQAAALDIEEGARFTGRSEMRSARPTGAPRLPERGTAARALAAGEAGSTLVGSTPDADAGAADGAVGEAGEAAEETAERV